MGLPFDKGLSLRDFCLEFLFSCSYYHIAGAGRRHWSCTPQMYHLALNRDEIITKEIRKEKKKKLVFDV